MVWWGRGYIHLLHTQTRSPELCSDQMGTAKKKWGRKVKGRLLAETGGLCLSLDHRLLSVAERALQKGVIKGADHREEGDAPSLLPPSEDRYQP